MQTKPAPAAKQLAPPEPQPTPHLSDILLDYQKRFLADDSPIVVCEKSRRVGITWCEAARAVLTAADANGADVFYLSYNYDVARNFIDHDVQEWAQILNTVARKAGQSLWDKDDESNESIYAYHVEFASGHKIYGLTSKPRSLRSRGRPGELAIIDEAALHDDLSGVLKAAIAFTLLGGRVHVISTHSGEDSPFAELVNNIRAGRMSRSYSLHRITIDDALADGYYQHVAAPLRHEPYSLAAEAEWRTEQFKTYGPDADEELLVIPSKGGGVFLSTALIESRMVDDVPVFRGRGVNAFDEIRADLEHALRTRFNPLWWTFFGEDFGRQGDLTVIWPMQIAENLMRRCPFIVELRDVEFEQQRAILFYIIDRLPRFHCGVLDANGNGQYLGEVTALRYGGSKVPISIEQVENNTGRIIPLRLSESFYREHMPKLKAAFEDNKIELPKSADVLADFRLLRTERGITKVPDARTRGSDAGMRHGDSAIAACLAYFASSHTAQDYSYQGISRDRAEPTAGDQRAREWEEDNRRGGGAWDILGGLGSGFRRRGAW